MNPDLIFMNICIWSFFIMMSIFVISFCIGLLMPLYFLAIDIFVAFLELIGGKRKK